MREVALIQGGLVEVVHGLGVGQAPRHPPPDLHSALIGWNPLSLEEMIGWNPLSLEEMTLLGGIRFHWRK